MSKLHPVDPRPNFPQLEENILKFWEDNQIFQLSLKKTQAGQRFVFFEGPPTANAKPGLHHIESRAFKDLIPRFQTMRGRFVARKAGWDTHGLPVEIQIEKALGISGKKQIESIRPTVRDSIIEFNRLCKESVWQYKEDWEKLTRRMGFWVDMSDPYVTYHNSYVESVWSVFKRIWDKGLVYSGHKVVHYCPRCGTALSSHEVAQGYKTVDDTSVYVKFRLAEHPDTYVLSWTTTPWTLPGNIALAVGANINYSKIKVAGEFWILATDRLSVLGDQAYETVGSYLGSDLVGLAYQPLFDVPSLQSEKSYQIYPADFVTTTDGTGVVHTAVMYGEDDYRLGEALGLPKVHTVDEAGLFMADLGELGGKPVKDPATEQLIIAYLERNNALLRSEVYSHEYPHCWRCNTPLLYYARDSWFIRMSELRDQLNANNEQVSWEPDYIKHGRFGEWLNDVKDWAISRDRYWGTPLPIWTCPDCGKHQAVGSIAELKLNTNTLIFGRHGQARNNILGIHSNHPEVETFPLTDDGRRQVGLMAERLKADGPIDMIFASDVLRTKQTAEIVAEHFGLQVQFDERLREYDLGEFNGRPLSEFHDHFSVQDRWTKAPKGGETYQQLQARALDFIGEVNSKYNDKRILIITHADVIWLLSEFYLSKNRYPEFAEYTQLEVSIPDVHRPYIDDVTLPCSCGSTARRTPAVMDVWFDSGCMPYAQWHYPFENQSKIDQGEQFPADYISEGIDQTRGWFYTLLAISTALDLGPAYKNVINLGHLLDKSGQKMSKSKGNIVEPWSLIGSHGIDAVRWYMYSVNQAGESKLFKPEDLDLIVRRHFLTLWNTLSFLTTYANHDNWEPAANIMSEKTHVLDRWAEAYTQQLVNSVTDRLEHYDIFRASRDIEDFINELSTWYVRRSRERKGPAFYQTLYEVMSKLAQVMAPFTPFLAENIWQVLRHNGTETSVHLSDWPEIRELSAEQKTLLEQMAVIQEAASLGLSARKELKIPVRQPLGRMAVVGKSAEMHLSQELLDILLSEINVRQADGDLVEEENPNKFMIAGSKDVLHLYLDSTMTDELKREGLARNLERLVQEIRKKSGLKVGETVNLSYHTSDQEVTAAFGLFDAKKTFVGQINAVNADSSMEAFEIDGKKVLISLS